MPRQLESEQSVAPYAKRKLFPHVPPLRLEFEGALYHVTSRSDRREPIVEDDEDRQAWLMVLVEALDRFHASAYAYCLMSNHYQLRQWVGTAHSKFPIAVGHCLSDQITTFTVEA